jgi:hypothetical protein
MARALCVLVTKATDTHTHTHTHTICNTYWFSTATVVSRTRLNVTLYVYCLSWFKCTSCEVRQITNMWFSFQWIHFWGKIVFSSAFMWKGWCYLGSNIGDRLRSYCELVLVTVAVITLRFRAIDVEACLSWIRSAIIMAHWDGRP